jgi:hypothetical protein
MTSKKSFSKTGIILILIFLSLACNIPNRFLFAQHEDDTPKQIQTFVAEYDATLVDDEGYVVSLPIPDQTFWICEDSDGIVSLLEEDDDLDPNKVLKKIILNLNFIYFEPRKGMKIDPEIYLSYYLNVERDETAIGPDNEIAGVNHAKWTVKGEIRRLELLDSWVFGGIMTAKVDQDDTYPIEGFSQREIMKSFYGLISSEDYHQAYLCDEGARPLPEGWDTLIDGEDFQNFCNGYYYECIVPSK